MVLCSCGSFHDVSRFVAIVAILVQNGLHVGYIARFLKVETKVWIYFFANAIATFSNPAYTFKTCFINNVNVIIKP